MAVDTLDRLLAAHVTPTATDDRGRDSWPGPCRQPLARASIWPHRGAAVQDQLAQTGIRLLYRRRYSPEFNPIEQAWDKVEERLKAKAARSLDTLEAELKPALDAITAKGARGWIRHAGYALH